jgi:hypothetical protein
MGPRLRGKPAQPAEKAIAGLKYARSKDVDGRVKPGRALGPMKEEPRVKSANDDP